MFKKKRGKEFQRNVDPQVVEVGLKQRKRVG